MLVRLQNDHTAKRFAMVSSKRSVRFRHSFAVRPPGVTEPRWPNTTRSGFATTMDVFFCEQASPWQRGSNENSDGLLCQYFPKGTELSGPCLDRQDGS